MSTQRPLVNALSLFGQPPTLGSLLTAAPPIQWIHVVRRFSGFLNNLVPTLTQIDDGTKKQAGIRACLNRHYWGTASETDNSMLIGSWGKQTRVRPSRDVDILFLLPPSLFHQYQERSGNKQSQLLQEVKSVLASAYYQTSMRGDGQVVVVSFNTTPIEVAPGFRCTDGGIIVCDTNNGGRYITSTSEAEERDLHAMDTHFNGNIRALARMMKRWQREKNVPLKSFQIERLAVEFLRGWAFSKNGLLWYDWMVRDFLAYLLSRAGTNLIMPGTGEVIPLRRDWLSRAETAYGHAIRACIYEQGNHDYLAGDSWQEIFATAIPRQAG